MNKKVVKKEVKPETPQEVLSVPEKDEVKIPAYLQAIVDKKPSGGDRGVVYACGYGWACTYPDKTTELLEEYIGLDRVLLEHGLDKYGVPLQVGQVIKTNITVEILNMLDEEDLGVLASPLGIKGNRLELIAQLTEKLDIK